MAEVTLTASMRANLYSLQQTAGLMGTVQGRLSTGKKVNSALDNPSNFFSSQSLTNRASDISSLLDGMGQAIQSIKAASQGITSVQSIVNQMKAVASSASQAITTASNASGTNVQGFVTLGTAGTAATLTTANAGSYALTNLGTSATTPLGIQNGDQMTAQVGTGATYTFTVGASAANNGTVGNGGGNTAADVESWLNVISGGSTAAITAGAVHLAATAAGITIAGTLATELGVNNTALSPTAAVAGTAAKIVPYTGQPAATGNTLVSQLTDGGGALLTNTATTTPGIGTGAGTYLSLSVGGGTTKTINITASTTVQNVMDSINSISGLNASIDATGALKVVNNNSTAVTIGGTASGLLTGTTGVGVGTAQGNLTSIAANSSLSTTMVQGYGQINASNLPAADLTNLQPPSGQNRIADGDQLSVQVGGTTTAITLLAPGSATAVDATHVKTVQDLMNSLGQISGITANLNSTTGQLDVSSSTGQTITFGGNAAAKLALPGTVAAGQSSLGGAGVNPTFLHQYDDLRSQLDQLVQDASYQGTNLISSTGNNPLTVTFNEAATNSNKLVIKSVDLTTTGLGITGAAGAWKDTGTIAQSLAQLTTAATTLRNQASTLGQNLTTVQTRQDFTNNMIATLKEGSDKLTLADMNEEGANMLALQTRSQLGTQSLSLASQANQAVMRLFG
jgi:flagellin